MAEYKNENNGAVWLNENSTPENRQPQFRGKGNFANLDFDIAVWIKQKDGKKFMTFEFKEPYVKQEQSNQSGYEKAKAVASSLKTEETDDNKIDLSEIPF